VAEPVSDYAKTVFRNLGLDKFSDLAIISTDLKTETDNVPCDVIVVIKDLPDGEGGEAVFEPLAMVIDARNRDALVPPDTAVLHDPSTDVPASDPGVDPWPDPEPPTGTSEALGDGPS
jgi:hypothetical protein